MAFNLNILEFPSSNDALCQVWLTWPSGHEQENKNMKSLLQRQRRRQRQRQQRTNFDQILVRPLWLSAKVEANVKV